MSYGKRRNSISQARLGLTACSTPTNSMKKNMGSAERIIRMVIAAVIALLFFTNIMSGTIGIILLIAAAIFVATSFISFCPIYKIFGASACSIQEE